MLHGIPIWLGIYSAEMAAGSGHPEYIKTPVLPWVIHSFDDMRAGEGRERMINCSRKPGAYDQLSQETGSE
jgi:hypothetical protein